MPKKDEQVRQRSQRKLKRIVRCTALNHRCNRLRFDFAETLGLTLHDVLVLAVCAAAECNTTESLTRGAGQPPGLCFNTCVKKIPTGLVGGCIPASPPWIRHWISCYSTRSDSWPTTVRNLRNVLTILTLGQRGLPPPSFFNSGSRRNFEVLFDLFLRVLNPHTLVARWNRTWESDRLNRLQVTWTSQVGWWWHHR